MYVNRKTINDLQLDFLWRPCPDVAQKLRSMHHRGNAGRAWNFICWSSPMLSSADVGKLVSRYLDVRSRPP